MDKIAFADRIKEDELPYAELTSLILKCCFDVMNELGTGFLESVYKNALCLALKQTQIVVEVEKPLDVYFRGQKVGVYKADILVQGLVIIELKCCKRLLPEHQAQVINYLKAANIPVGLLINFGHKNLDYNRLHHPLLYSSVESDIIDPVFSNLPF
ncbi:MAG: GxxExxY protein [Parachlamydiaceae bacterium]|nr:GxxExxY protein [Parachlamydiaceae bacterium]